MTTADEIKQAVLSLPEAEYAKIMDWLHELAEDGWDRQFEEDVLAGKLDFMKAEVEQAKRGRQTEGIVACIALLPSSGHISGDCRKTIRRTARRNFQLLKASPRHPSHWFKKVNEYWAVRVGRSYRAIAIEERRDLFWVWIGNHDEYMRIIRGYRLTHPRLSFTPPSTRHCC